MAPAGERAHPRAWMCPPTAILGGLGTAAAFVVAMALDPVILLAGGGWMVVGMTLYVLYRRHQGLPLKEHGQGREPGAPGSRGG